MGMDWVVVKRYHRKKGDDEKYYLSRVSMNYLREEGEGDDKIFLKDYSASEICKLSDFKDGAVILGNICRDWIFFHDTEGQFVAYNITTEEVRQLPPYNSRRLDIMHVSSGMGYDPKSDDYKVVRSFNEFDELGYMVCHRVELYSLKTDSLRSIRVGEGASYISCTCPGVYVGGKYYWASGTQVQCFDFTDETYSVIPQPPPPHGYRFPDYNVFLVQCRGHLGIISSPGILEDSEFWRRPGLRPGKRPTTSSSFYSNRRKTFEVWVWKDDSSWTKLYEAALHHAVKPLCLIDGRISFFQGETHELKCDLLFYDWITKDMKKFNISDYPGHMQVFTGGLELELPPAPDNASPTPTLYTEEEIRTDKAWLRPHNASLALKKKKKKKKKKKTGQRRPNLRICVSARMPPPSAKRMRSRKKAFKGEDV